METIYGIQADTETLREAHELQRQRLLGQQHAVTNASTIPASTPKTGFANLKSPPQPTLVARSTSASALPANRTLGLPTSGNNARTSTSKSAIDLGKGLTASTVSDIDTASAPATANTATAAPAKTLRSPSETTSPFLHTIDHHHQNMNATGQLRSTTQSPAFLSKLYDSEHHHWLPNSIPWLALPGAAVPTTTGNSLSGTESSGGSIGVSATGSNTNTPALFGRHQSDTGLPSSERSTPALVGFDKLSLSDSAQLQQQENPSPCPPQLQHHHQHHHHLLSHQELAALSRNNSPMPLSEALPNYLRKKAVDPFHSTSMERSFSNPGNGGAPGPNPANVIHTAPVSPFLLPIPPSTAAASQGGGGSAVAVRSVGSSGGPTIGTASPSHLLFQFPASASHLNNSEGSSDRPEMERARSTGVLPIYRPQLPHRHYRTHPGHGHHQNNTSLHKPSYGPN